MARPVSDAPSHRDDHPDSTRCSPWHVGQDVRRADGRSAVVPVELDGTAFKFDMERHSHSDQVEGRRQSNHAAVWRLGNVERPAARASLQFVERGNPWAERAELVEVGETRWRRRRATPVVVKQSASTPAAERHVSLSVPARWRNRAPTVRPLDSGCKTQASVTCEFRRCFLNRSRPDRPEIGSLYI